MIWPYLKKIGECNRGVSSNTSINVPDDLQEYINTTYPNPPSENKIITVNMPISIVTKKMAELTKLIESHFEEFRTKYLGIEMNDDTAGKILEDFFKILPPTFIKELGKLWTTEILDYNSEIANKMLRGEQTGRSPFYSITHFAKCKPKEGIADLPLWKINLQKKSWDTSEIRDFMEMMPTNAEMNKIVWENGPIALVRFAISELFRRIVNSTFVSLSFKAKFYHICFKINGKWPYEYPEFIEYYLSQIQSSQTGLCAVCGKINVSVQKLLTKEIGFYTDDQWSSQLKFSADPIPLCCKECVSDIKIGFSYVKKYLRYFISGRGTGKNPFEMYILPYSTDLKLLKSILKEIENIRFRSSETQNNKGLKTAVERGQISAMIDQEKKPKKGTKKTMKPLEKSGSDSNSLNSLTDIFEFGVSNSEETNNENDTQSDYFNILMYPSKLEDQKLNDLSYMIVIFVHPEGNASNFHNIIDIILADGQNLKKFAQILSEICEKYSVKPIIFKNLSHVINEFYYPKFLADLLQMVPINRENFYHNAYIENKKGFLQATKSLGSPTILQPNRSNEGQWNNRNMFLLEITTSLIEALNLWA